MSSKPVILIFIFLCVNISNVAASYERGPNDVLIKRNGLPDFFKKINDHKPVTVAYLSGSITEAPNGWRDFTQQWLKEKYPAANFKEVMAAIGGTGSDFGAYRLQEHVLKHNPDLVFIEFAVNDHDRKFEDIQSSIEGIVRQIRRHNRFTDICFVYTISISLLKDYEKNILPTSVKAMETIAARYGIPSVNFAPCILQKLETKQLAFDNKNNPDSLPLFSEDGVHPVENGHRAYAATITDALIKMSSRQKKFKHKLPVPLSINNLENARMISLMDAGVIKTNGWIIDSNFAGGAFKNRIPIVLSTGNTADSIVYHFNGTAIGIADIMGPTSSKVRFVIDGKIYDRDRFDVFSSYYRTNYSIVDGLPKKQHTVVIKLSPDKPDKKKILPSGTSPDAHNLYITYLLVSY